VPPVAVPLVIKNCGITVGESLPRYLARPTLDGALQLSRMYRRMGVGFLFLSGLPERMFAHLSRSARTYVYFLEKADDSDKATSRAEPLFDGVASGDDAAVRRIAVASRRTWNPRLEYEDDFLYVEFILETFFRSAEVETSKSIVRRYEAVLGGAPDRRLDLAKAVLERRQAGFDGALDALIAELVELVEMDRDEERLDPEHASTCALLSPEILAWLRLAENAGLRSRPSYRLAPDVARLLSRAGAPSEDSWRTFEKYTELRPETRRSSSPCRRTVRSASSWSAGAEGALSG